MNCFFVNVYSTCLGFEKRELWSELLNFKNRLGVGEWLVGGDFNAVKSKVEGGGIDANRLQCNFYEWCKYPLNFL